jgi:hypothetical protein
MSPTPKDREIEKLRKQVEQFERKGYFDTAAHIMLARLLGKNPPEAVSPQNAKKAKTEAVIKENDNGE